LEKFSLNATTIANSLDYQRNYPAYVYQTEDHPALKDGGLFK
jgi:hypothetical protein